MKFKPLMSEHYRRLEEECPVCEDGTLYKDEKKREKFCSSCHVVLDKHTFETDDDDDEWVDFFSYRAQEYAGFHGPKRLKFVGGFARPYDFESDF